MGKRLYVGNIPYTATEEHVREFFAPRPLTEVRFITDRDTGRPRGYCFVELADEGAAAEAIEVLNGAQMGGRAVVVNMAKDREPTGGGGKGGGGRGNRGGRRDRSDDPRSRSWE